MALLLCSPCALALAAPKRRAARLPVHVTERGQIVRLISGKTPALESIMSLRRSPELHLIARHVNLLTKPGVEYQRAYLSNTHVALVRKSGIIDLVTTADAAAHVKAGKPMVADKLQVGVGSGGRWMFGEHGPNNTLRLYRQLPAKANGQVASSDGYTSFALSESDAYHPFGAAGKTVTVAVPRPLFDRALSGELGGSGWTGGGIGIDVEEEVQIDSRHVKKLVP